MLRDVHPIPGNPPDRSLSERVTHLECALARLWDQVWWMNLAPERREAYARDGFKAPIQRFYVPLEDTHREA